VVYPKTVELGIARRGGQMRRLVHFISVLARRGCGCPLSNHRGTMDAEDPSCSRCPG